MTQVINARNAPSGWRHDPQFTYIGRPSYLGNPFRIGVHGDRDEVIRRYREEHLPVLRAQDPARFDDYLRTCISGQTLVCFCKPLACHGDVLVEMAERIGD